MDISAVYNSKAIAAYWNDRQENANVAPFVGEAFFPDQKKNGLTLSFFKGASGVPVALAPSAFDALAPIRDRIGLEVIQGEMPYFKESYLLKETDRQKIMDIEESDNPYLPALLSELYKDSENLINGAAVQRERMRMQLLAPVTGTPKIIVTLNGTNMEYNYDPDNSWQATNFESLSGNSRWTAYGYADPLADLRDGINTVVGLTGNRPRYALMSDKTWNDIMKCDSVKAYIQATVPTGGAIFINDGVVRQLLRQTLQLEVIVYTKKYKANQNATAANYYPDDLVTLLPDGAVGNTWFGTTPFEADLNAGVPTDTTIVDTGVAVKVLHTGEHSEIAQIQTLAAEIVLPSFEGMSDMYVIKTA